MEKVIVIIDDRTSIPYTKLIPSIEVNNEMLNDIARTWIGHYIFENEYNYNPFRYTISNSNDKDVKKIKRVQKIIVLDDTNFLL
jgi:hypothetical protein